MLLPFFAVTLFVSAFLLFLVQPMIGKMILPRLGGTPQVWNTCMMFFQMALLAGYAYTHTLSTRLKARQQMMVHGLLLLVPLAVLFSAGRPFNISNWQPPAGGNPIPDTLWLLTLVVGIPFFVVSTTAPLLQKWFAYTGHEQAKDPYFLYGASNLGSLLALLAYPYSIEWMLGLNDQAWTWAIGYLVLAGMVGTCIYMVLMSPGARLDQVTPEEPPPPEYPVPPDDIVTAVKSGPAPDVARVTGRRKPGQKAVETSEAPAAPVKPRVETLDFWRRLRWVLLAAAPSSMMLGVTSYISIDLSPVPLFWVIPLAIYLATFIIVFLKYPVAWTGRPHNIVLWIQPFTILLLCYFYIQGFHPLYSISATLLGFFFSTMVCHGELARDRPSTRYLTEFYLWMSFGGMLGGVFNGLIAPVLFTGGVLEYPLAITLVCLLRPVLRDDWADKAVINTFPGIVPWFKEKGDALAKALGRPAPHNAYLLSLVITVVLVGIYFVFTLLVNPRTVGSWSLEAWAKFLGFNPESEDPSAAEWGSWFVGIQYRIIAYFVPLLVAVTFLARPMRFGLAIGAFLLTNLYLSTLSRTETLLHGTRSYFGVLRVYEESEILSPQERVEFAKASGEVSIVAPDNYLMHGTTHHGLNYQYPQGLRRLATTYYHRKGPVGVVMERINWFHEPQNAYWSDARLPAALVGLGGATMGVASLPMAEVVGAWSEPPYATIGLGTGTMASYGRPMQHVTFYEIDDNIRSFSLPGPDGTTLPRIVETTLTSDVKEPGKDEPSVALAGRIAPGMALVIDEGKENEEIVSVESGVRVRYGDTDRVGELAPRSQLADNRFTAVFQKPHKKGASVRSVYPYFNYLSDAKKRGVNLEVIMGDARLSLSPEREGVDERSPAGLSLKREKYYRVMEIDAFSSDAIPVHLVTKEAIQLYFDHLTEDGVVCVHTSNRHLDLVKPVVDIAIALGLKYRVGNDRGKQVSDERGHYQSEYVMLARDDKYLPKEEDVTVDSPSGKRAYLHWTTPEPAGERLWTDDYSNLVGVMRENEIEDERVRGRGWLALVLAILKATSSRWLMLLFFALMIVFVAVVMMVCKQMDKK